MNKIRNIFKIIVNYPSINKWKIVEAIKLKKESDLLNAINKCKMDAIKLKKEEDFRSVPGQLAILNDIIENPEKHYEEFDKYGDIDLYLDYLVYSDQSVS
tara:strand:+ start:14 stop:313 length:300 start_codon:yes stop_codon:yes gene_type:complete